MFVCVVVWVDGDVMLVLFVLGIVSIVGYCIVYCGDVVV